MVLSMYGAYTSADTSQSLAPIFIGFVIGMLFFASGIGVRYRAKLSMAFGFIPHLLMLMFVYVGFSQGDPSTLGDTQQLVLWLLAISSFVGSLSVVGRTVVSLFRRLAR